MKKESDPRIYAVLTGDIVGSSKLPLAERKRLPALIRSEGERLCALWPGRVPKPPDVFRGDGWQWLVTEPASALRVGLILRLRLRALLSEKESDSRVSIGIGTVDFLPRGKTATGDGEAFRRSGRGLEAMAEMPERRLAIHASTENAALDAALLLLDELIGRWTKKQGLAVAGAMEGLTQEEIAREWPESISQPSIKSHLDRAGWSAVEAALLQIESIPDNAL